VLSPELMKDAVSERPPHIWQRLYRNTAALGFAQIVNVASNILLIPLFLTHWPTEVYGEWIAISALAVYYSTADMGMNAASGNALIKAYQRKECKQYREIQASALLFYLSMACAVTALSAATCFLLPVARWLGVVHIPRATAALVMFLVASRLVWTMPAGQIWNIFRTTGNLSTSQWIANLQAFGVFGVTAAVLYLGGGVATLALWTWCPLVLCAVLAWVLVRRAHQDLLPRLRAASLRGVADLSKPSLLFALMMVSTLIRVTGPVIVVAHLLGGAAVALVVTTRTVANVLTQVPAMICWALWPELTRLDAIGNKAGLRAAHNFLVASYMAISITFVGALWFEGQGLIEVWTRGHLLPQPWLVRTFLLYVLCQAPWIASSMLAGATNRHRTLAWCQLLAAVAGVALVALLLPKFKLLAVPLGLLAGEALACYHFVIADACTLAERSYRKFATRVWFTLSFVTTLTLAMSAVAHRMPIASVPVRILVAGIVSAFTAAAGVWKLLLPESERQLIVKRFRATPPCKLANSISTESARP